VFQPQINQGTNGALLDPVTGRNLELGIKGEYAQGLDQLQEPRAYLTTIARNLLINQVRRRAIEQAYLDALAAMPEPVAPPPEVRLMVLETLVEIDRRLGRLPALAKQAFLLAQLEGLSHGEIAAELGISISTVKRHLAKAAMRCFFPE
jgi:RNA polymerase sigma-70 factor (ECF subfamily)